MFAQVTDQVDRVLEIGEPAFGRFGLVAGPVTAQGEDVFDAVVAKFSRTPSMSFNVCPTQVKWAIASSLNCSLILSVTSSVRARVLPPAP
jgi:hypothetical protein